MYVADRRHLRGMKMWVGAHPFHAFNPEDWAARFIWTPYNAPSLPAEPGVYVVVTYDDIPIYIGSTYVSLLQRWGKHHRRDAFERLGADRIAYMTCNDPEAHYLYGLELTMMNALLPILNDRSDNAVAVEFFGGKRRLIPLSEEPGVGWRTRWKVKPAVGWPKGKPRKADRPTPPPSP
jgi:hypothetical protein